MYSTNTCTLPQHIHIHVYCKYTYMSFMCTCTSIHVHHTSITHPSTSITHTHTHTRTYARTHARTHTHTYTHTHTCTHRQEILTKIREYNLYKETPVERINSREVCTYCSLVKNCPNECSLNCLYRVKVCSN